MTEKKMNRRVKKKWVEALRSGEFDQAEGVLCDGNNGYCCLGVLSELAVREGKAEKWLKEDRRNVWYGKKRGDADDVFLPRSVRRWAGLDSDNPSVPNGYATGSMSSLASLNDYGRTFEEIADLIEQHL